jgi:hypothetical protein
MVWHTVPNRARFCLVNHTLSKAGSGQSRVLVQAMHPADVPPSSRFGVGVSAIIEHPDYPGLRFAADLAEDGRVVQWTIADRSMLAFPGEPGQNDPSWGPVTSIGATALRTVAFGELERLVRVQVGRAFGGASAFPQSADGMTPAELKRLEDVARTVGDARRGAMNQPLDDGFYASVAEVYVAAARSKSPVREVADRMRYSRNTVANWLSEARNRGLLSPTSPGRSGGVLTAKAKAILNTNGEKAKP